MAPTSAAMELKVLISILQSGTALSNMLSQVNQLSQALTKLQQQTNAAGGKPIVPPIPPIPPGILQNLLGIPPAVNTANVSMEGLEKTINKLFSAVKFLAGGFLALQSVRFLRGLADEAARVQVLTTVLHVVAANAGTTAEEIDKVDKSVQKLGITASASKQALTQFLQARLKLEFAPQLARAAQDLAVIAGGDSSETFRRLIVNVQQLDTLGLRMQGLVVDRALAETKFKEAIGATTRELNKREQQEALLREVIEKAKQLEGAYSSAMGDVGKQLTSLNRLTETYRATLGESLLPAYSAIVRVVGTTLEKLVLISKEFSANRERAAAWADAAEALATGISKLILFIAQHADQLVYLTQLYIGVKLALFALNGATTVFLRLVAFGEVLNRLRVVFVAWQAGLTSVTVALRILGAASTQEAIKIAAVAIAQQGIATTAAPAVAGLQAVTGAAVASSAALATLVGWWAVAAAAIAVPIFGYIRIKEIREEGDRPALERAKEALDRLRELTGRAELSVQEALNLPAGQSLPIVSQLSVLQATYSEWRKQQEATGKSEVELRKEFQKTFDAFDKKGKAEGLADRLGAAKAELTRRITEREELFKEARKEGAKVTPGERKVAEERVTDAQKRVDDLRVEMKKMFTEMDLSPSTQALSDQIDLVDELSNRLVTIRDKNLTSTTEDITRAEAQLEEAKARKEAMEAQFEKNLEREELKGIIDPGRRRDMQAAIDLKKRLVEVADAAERVSTGTKEAFGEKFAFGPGGTGSGQFGKILGGMQPILEEAGRMLKETGEIPFQMAERLRRGLIALGQAASEPLDLSRLRTFTTELNKLSKEEVGPGGISGLQEKAQTALALAEQGVRQTRLGIRAPIVSERRTQIQQETELTIVAAKRELDNLKTGQASQTEALEDAYRQNLLGLDFYYRRKIEMVIEGGDAELKVLEKQLAQKLAIQAAEEDPRAKAALTAEIVSLRNQFDVIQGRVENEVDRLRNQREQRRRDLTRDVTGETLALAAQLGGEAEAIALLTHQLEQERKKFSEARDPRAAELDIMKELVRTEEILKRFRDTAFERQLALEQELRTQLDLEQQVRDIKAAGDRADVAQGRLTTNEANQREAIRLNEQLQANRQRRDSAERERDLRERRQLVEVGKLRELLARLPITEAERIRRVEEAQRQHTAEIQESVAAVKQLDQAYIDLIGSIRTLGDDLRDAFKNELTNLFTEALAGFGDKYKTFMENLKQLGMGTMRVIAEAISANLAEKITEAVASIGAEEFTKEEAEGMGRPELEGKRKPGTGIFDDIFRMLGLGEEVTIPVGARANPSYAHILSMPDIGQPGQSTPVPGAEGQFNVPSAQNLFQSGINYGAQFTSRNIAPLANLVPSVANLFRAFTPTTPTIPIVSGIPSGVQVGTPVPLPRLFTKGGPVDGPGTGTSDSIPALVSAGEHIMPAAKAARFMPLLEGIRLGTLAPAFALGGVVTLQSIAPAPTIPRRYAAGGVVVADGGAASVQTGGGAGGNMTVTMHPDTLNMTMREWLEHEVVRQYGRR